ncbi:MAG: hypothetical protein HXM17_10350, partial [Fusobacterium periodonticum]|nr:hypothetical protein [Fusobacterium periodonticum]
MPKIMLKNPTETKTESYNNLSLTKPVEKTKTTVEPVNLQRLLRKKRSKRYMEAMGALDTGGHVNNQEKINELIEAIREEFPEVELIKTGIFIGMVSKCFLGDPYEVHTVDFTHTIIKHYKQGETLPDGMEKARAIAARNIYMYIEV